MAKVKKESLSAEELLGQALVPKGDQPYDVPANWVWTYLTTGFAECLDKFRKPINAAERAERGGDVPYYGATGQVGWIDDFLTNEHLVLIGEDGAPFFDYLKDKAYVIQGKAWVNNHAHILKSYYGMNGNKFLMHYLNIFNYNGYVNGTTRLKLTQASMNMMPVPIPPLAEQQRIVDRIESMFAKLDQAKELAQKALDSFETRKAAILHKAFTGELTANWREEHTFESAQNRLMNIIETRSDIGSKSKELAAYMDELLIDDVSDANGWLHLKAMLLCDNITCGGTPTGFIYEHEDIPFLKVYNIVDNKIAFDEKPQFTNRETHNGKLKSSKLKPNDVIMNIVGPPLRKIAVIPEDYAEWNMNQALVRFRTTEHVLPKYFYYCLVYPATLDEVISDTKGVVGQANISVTQSRNLNIPVPSLEEQYEIVHILDSFFDKEQKAKELIDVIDTIDMIKKSMLARAFRGELGTNDPSEESALKLLKEVVLTQ
ncbi:restriction endonuclease subunit S [Paenibacillus sp. VMFN-D1]|uniref:restriction endonuclease subunit S n=1 Tax=Paenibacillus sp. VMFN-D1 TaxID=2135608 RepID=UPI000E25A9FC|nr:restriction endonuclease subunit S [Paenibacillus sp. VMFN-D1]RED32188.1 type I restriction enzyme S subunit [Paenibacillus sp. VMFN-D1]